MATTKKTTTTKSTTTKKVPAKRTTKPRLEIVKDEPVQELSVFEQMAARFPVTKQEVDLGDGLKVNVVNRIPLQDTLELIKRITDVCIDEQRGEVHYHMFDFTAKLFIVAVYCGIAVPENVEVGFDATCGTDRLYDRIKGYIDPYQLDMIWRSCGAILNEKNDMFNSAAAKLTIDIIQRVNELYEMISGVTENFDSQEAIDALKKFSAIAGTTM